MREVRYPGRSDLKSKLVPAMELIVNHVPENQAPATPAALASLLSTLFGAATKRRGYFRTTFLDQLTKYCLTDNDIGAILEPVVKNWPGGVPVRPMELTWAKE